MVGVVGIGHTAGIVKNWLKVDEDELANILAIPQASFSVRAFKITVKYSLLGLLGFGIYKISKPPLKAISNFVLQS